MESRSESQTGGGSPGGPLLIRNAAPAVSTKQTAPPAEGEPITRRFTSSLASLKVGVATNRSNRALQRAGEWGRGDKVRKGMGFATFAGRRAGGPVDGLRQERCCCGGAGEEEKKQRRRKAGQEADPVPLTVDQSDWSAAVLEVKEGGGGGFGCGGGWMSGEEDEISGEVGGRWRRIPRVNYSGKEELESNTLHLICKAAAAGGGKKKVHLSYRVSE